MKSRRHQQTFCDGFSVFNCDKSTCCTISLLAFVFLSVIIGYASQLNFSSGGPHAMTHESNNSAIWFREEPLMADRNRSSVATAREPQLIVALKKLQLTHELDGNRAKLYGRSVGEYDSEEWQRKPQIDKLWLKLIDNLEDIQRVCHVGLSGGYTALMYLEALPDAKISIYDPCNGAQSSICDTVEKFLKDNYSSKRIKLHRTSAPFTDVVKQYNGTCDWVGVDLSGSNDVPQHLIPMVAPAANCPNILYFDNVGRETNDEQLANIAMAWEEGIGERISMQHTCDSCHGVDNDQCTFCFGELLCGAVKAEVLLEQKQEEEAKAAERERLKLEAKAKNLLHKQAKAKQQLAAVKMQLKQYMSSSSSDDSSDEGNVDFDVDVITTDASELSADDVESDGSVFVKHKDAEAKNPSLGEIAEPPSDLEEQDSAWLAPKGETVQTTTNIVLGKKPGNVNEKPAAKKPAAKKPAAKKPAAKKSKRA